MLRSTLLPPLSFFPSHINPRLKLLSTATTSLHRPPTVCENSPTSAYIHLPFCRKRCHYCDFPIIALGTSSSSSPDDDPRISNYTGLLLREIQLTTPSPAPLKTVFFGGGTPSLVPPRLLSSILAALRDRFGVERDAEVSMEMDPGTFDAGRMDDVVGVGVNRVSLGVQAFQEGLLRSCGRAHGVREVEEALEVVKGCGGLENWSLDLISSLPRQSEGMWEESLRRAADAGPTHVSVYDLQVEQGTKFGNLYTPGEFPLPTEVQSANFYKMASDMLTGAGYDHYEISSYCRPGYECRHNLTYWQNRPFYAFGLGSASYLDGVRFSRPRKLKEYADYVGRLGNGGVATGSSAAEAKDAAADVVMLSLRTARGLDVNSFARSFGKPLVVSLCEAYRPYVESGHVVAMDGRRRRLSYCQFESRLSGGGGGDDGMGDDAVAFIRLSDPDGFLLSNELISIAFGAISP
ncbi:Uncharacterized protein M6B38_112580 [Iris pallida]|uniref:Radical S-adenosyl methionine domain-containing protein 1, mitochondrial n=1 Tax=Iris pallida TaxID=29817 RepID=A0AAX6DMS4_IRIPA|nr:Uncharacterized protein M6B38_112580 [Iris pallida]